ncbi:retention module-containing protein, partial [uncultured Aquitalea sp.]|uniref:retention module-containing protein n=1 Tax=uncultured Aquitalea sp. TaxID=540272 RepID=UPI0025F9FE95
MNAPAIQGQVVALHGVVKVIDAQGHERILKVGDIIQPGEHVVLLDGASLTVGRAGGESVTVDGPRDLVLTDDALTPNATDKSEAAVAKLAPEAQQILAALENGQDPLANLDSAAAGLNAAGGPASDGSHSFIRLSRISESISGLTTDTATSTTAAVAENTVQAQGANQPAQAAVTIDDVSLTNNNRPLIHGTGISGETVIVTDTQGNVIGSAVVDGSGNWSFVPTQALPDGTTGLIATATNTGGQTATANGSAVVDTTPPGTPPVTIVDHNGVINASDVNNGKVEATVKLDAADLAKNGSATIVVNDGGHTTTLVVHSDGSVTGSDGTVTGTYSNGTVTISMTPPGQGAQVVVTATQTDAAGNTSGQGADTGTLHSALPVATISVDNVTADNVLNIQELGGDIVTITGVVGGDAKLGDAVTLTIGSSTYTTTVIEINGHLGFSQLVSTGTLADSTNIHATVTVTDSYNNTTTAATDHGYGVDLVPPVAHIAVDNITDDNVIN